MSEEKEQLVIGPQPGRQTEFLMTSADIAVFGGSAGGGKTFSLLMEPMRHLSNGGFNSVLFRRTTTQLTKQGASWDESAQLYTHASGFAREGALEWKFPSGASIQFAHLQYEKTKYDWDGSQICLLLFDELQHFTASQFFYLLSRNRSTCGVRPYVRATCNPDPDSWLAEFISWWIDQDRTTADGNRNPRWGLPIEERAGKLRWFVRDGEHIVWANSSQELQAKYPLLVPKSVTFIPSSIYDNKILMEKDPGYLSNLMAQMPVEKARLLEGNWKVKHGAGQIFDRSWFKVTDVVPHGGVDCRFWDMAATAHEVGSRQREPDYTVGIKIKRVNGRYYIVDMIDVQIGPAEVWPLMRDMALEDQIRANDQDARYMLRWEREPAGAGKRESIRVAQSFDQYDAKGVLVRKDKISRAMPLATQARAGGVSVVSAPWTERFLTHLHNQPDWPYDDIMDATSGAYNELAHMLRAPEVSPVSITKSSSWHRERVGV